LGTKTLKQANGYYRETDKDIFEYIKTLNKIIVDARQADLFEISAGKIPSLYCLVSRKFFHTSNLERTKTDLNKFSQIRTEINTIGAVQGLAKLVFIQHICAGAAVMNIAESKMIIKEVTPHLILCAELAPKYLKKNSGDATLHADFVQDFEKLFTSQSKEEAANKSPKDRKEFFDYGSVANCLDTSVTYAGLNPYEIDIKEKKTKKNPSNCLVS
jgi:hypothetical protein